MGFLTSDHAGFYPQKFMEQVHLNPTDTARDLGAPRASLYKNVIQLKPSTKLKERILAIVAVTDVAFQLFGKNPEETAKWLTTPNILLFGKSPFEICLRGDGNVLIKWLLDRAGVEAVPIRP